jgi:hypothetical protein
MSRCRKAGCKLTQWSNRGLCYGHEKQPRGFVFDPERGRFVKPKNRLPGKRPSAVGGRRNLDRVVPGLTPAVSLAAGAGRGAVLACKTAERGNSESPARSRGAGIPCSA